MPRTSRSFMNGRPSPPKLPGGELAVEVPQGEAVRLDLEVGVAALAVLQRVGVGHQVATDAVGVDQLEDPGLLADLVVVRRGDVVLPADRLVGDPQGPEDLVVEATLAEQQSVETLEELARLRALDDPVVVGGGEGHHLADRVAGDRVLGGALVLRGVLHRADADDRALPAHQARHRVVGADGARVGQGDRGALEVLDGELAVARLADDVLVGGPERREVHRLGGLDVGNQELTGAVGLLHVDREAEVDVGRGDLVGLAVDHVEADVHLGHRLERLDQRVADQVGERHLAAASTGEVVVDHDAVVPEQLDRHRAHGGRGGDGQGVVHVGHGAGGGAAQHGVGRLVGRRGGRGPLLLLGHRTVGALGRLVRLGLRARLGPGGRDRRRGGGGLRSAGPSSYRSSRSGRARRERRARRRSRQRGRSRWRRRRGRSRWRRGRSRCRSGS